MELQQPEVSTMQSLELKSGLEWNIHQTSYYITLQPLSLYIAVKK
jgi:hypothetical protein